MEGFLLVVWWGECAGFAEGGDGMLLFLLLWVLEDRSNRFRPVLEESEARGLRILLLALKTQIAW